MEAASNEHVIHFNPIFSWHAKPLPTKVPGYGSQGGVIIDNRNSVKGFIQKISVDNDKRINNDKYYQAVYFGGFGFGVGMIVPVSKPILIGTASLNSSMGPSLYIGVVLFISAIIWSITHLVIPSNWRKIFRPKTRKIIKSINNNKDILLETIKENDLKASRIDQFFSISTGKYVQNDNGSVTLNSMNKPQTMHPKQAIFQSSVRVRELESPTSNSSWSFQTALFDNQFPGHEYFTESSNRNQIVELQNLELILTISEFRCPNSWMRKNGTKISHFEPSPFEECLEVFLLFQERLLIGKLRNSRHKRMEGEFVIQMWRTLDGILEKFIPTMFIDTAVSCDAVCPIYDKFLVLLRQGEVFVWDLLSNAIVTKIVLQNCQLIKGRYSIQTTKNGSDIIIVIFYPANETSHIYTCNTMSLISGNSSFKYKSCISKKSFYSLILENEIAIGSENDKLVIWDFSSNQERLLHTENGESLHTILTSADGEIILLQSNDRISFWKTRQWHKLSNIFLHFNRICSMVLSLRYGRTYLFAVALENGFIHIFDTSNGQLLQTLQTKIPITYMVFSNYNSILIAVANRASHYQLTLFNIQ